MTEKHPLPGKHHHPKLLGNGLLSLYFGGEQLILTVHPPLLVSLLGYIYSAAFIITIAAPSAAPLSNSTHHGGSSPSLHDDVLLAPSHG